MPLTLYLRNVPGWILLAFLWAIQASLSTAAWSHEPSPGIEALNGEAVSAWLPAADADDDTPNVTGYPASPRYARARQHLAHHGRGLVARPPGLPQSRAPPSSQR